MKKLVQFDEGNKDDDKDLKLGEALGTINWPFTTRSLRTKYSKAYIP